jgi:hypothetical protein
LTTPTATTTTTAASVTSDSSLSLRVGPLITQYKTNTEDRKLLPSLLILKGL